MHDIVQKFKNDYNQTCHPDILHTLQAINHEHFTGYGLDSISAQAEELLRKKCQCNAAHIHFIAGGTLTNLVTIAAFLRPHQAVIAAHSGHINIHETGAIEATGHKVLTAPSCDGKLYPEQIKTLYYEHNNEHMVQAKLVYLSQSTELGSVYSKAELTAIAHVCKELGLYLFIDGARLGAALTASMADMELADLAKLADAFYIGGTKNGALFGEALVLLNPIIQGDFRYLCKQRGAMLAKGWLISSQFKTLFENDLFYTLARKGNEVAKYIHTELESLQVPLLTPTYTNQIFPILPTQTVKKLAQSHAFEIWSPHDKTQTIRFVCSFATSMNDADFLLEKLKEAL